jgi:excisionase family DNA binding protein
MHDSKTRSTLNVEEVAAQLGISRAVAYEAVRTGRIPSLRIGRRLLVPRRALDAMLDGVQRRDREEHQ